MPSQGRRPDKVHPHPSRAHGLLCQRATVLHAEPTPRRRRGGRMTSDEARAALVDYLRSHGHGKFVDDYIADLVQAAKAEALRDLARKLYERGHLRVSLDDMAHLVMARSDAEEEARATTSAPVRAESVSQPSGTTPRSNARTAPYMETTHERAPKGPT